MTITDTHLEEVLTQYHVLFDDWIPNNATIALAYEDRYIYYVPKQFDIQIRVNDVPAETSIAFQTIQTKQKVEKLVEDPIKKLSYYGIGYPITIKGKNAALIIVLPPSYAKHSISELRFITGKHEEEWVPVPVPSISYFESYNKKNWFYIDTKQYQISLTMKELEMRLPKDFIRIHRSYIVNIHTISKIYRDITSNLVIETKDGTTLPVSQSYIAALRQVLEF